MTEPARLHAVAAVLRELSGEIDALGASLCADPEIVSRYARELQAVDLIAQVQTALAEVVSAECMHCAVAEVRLDSLRERLNACLPHAGCAHPAA
jgi:hypothetical protein